MILGMRNYYNMATNIVIDMRKINFDIMRTLDNRLKKIISKTPSKSKRYEKLHGAYSGIIRTVCGITIFQIYDCKERNIMNFTQEICNYTEEC